MEAVTFETLLEERLSDQAKEVLRRDDLIQKLEAKRKELENDYLKL